MPSSWTDLDRPPLSQQRLQRVVTPDGRWRELRVVGRTGSTNADVAAAARAGAGPGLVIVAEQQDGGRGRLDRRWEAPPRSSVLMSMLVQPAVSPPLIPLLPLVIGIAVAEAIRQVASLDATLKWPNDVLFHGRKLGGILVERVGDVFVAGVGINVSTRTEELPIPQATSLFLGGAHADREPLVKEILRAVDRWLATYETDRDDAGRVLRAYREICETIGRRVRVDLPGGRAVAGTVERVDDAGRLVVRSDDGESNVLAVGDVTHVRAEA